MPIAAMAHARNVDSNRERRWLAEISGLRALLAAFAGEDRPERDEADDRLRRALEGIIAGALQRGAKPDMSGDPMARLNPMDKRHVQDTAYEVILLLRGEGNLVAVPAPKP